MPVEGWQVRAYFEAGANGVHTPQAAQARIAQAREALRAGTMTTQEYTAVQEQYGPLAAMMVAQTLGAETT